MRVAIVHERFTELGGSEKVVEQLYALWPGATVFAALVDPGMLPAGLREADVRSSRLQRLYRGGRGYAQLLPLLPGAFRSLDLSGFDLVVTSHHAFANRVEPTLGTPVISYTYTPARWMWNAAMRRGEPGGLPGRVALGAFAATQRRADRRAAQRPRLMAVISHTVSDRVRCWWERDDAIVIHPPVDVERFTPGPETRDDFYLLAGRLVPYKRPLVAVQAARRAGVRLVVAGDGRERRALEAEAGGDVEVLGAVDDATLLALYRRCRALIFPGVEDFGLVPVEAQACGTPVVGRREGGLLDSVVEGVTGELYDPADEVGTLAETLRRFDPARFDAARIRQHALGFSSERFRSEMRDASERSLGSAAP